MPRNDRENYCRTRDGERRVFTWTHLRNEMTRNPNRQPVFISRGHLRHRNNCTRYNSIPLETWGTFPTRCSSGETKTKKEREREKEMRIPRRFNLRTKAEGGNSRWVRRSKIIRGEEKTERKRTNGDFNRRNKTSRTSSPTPPSFFVSFSFFSAEAEEKWAYHVVKRSRGWLDKIVDLCLHTRFTRDLDN